jgi:hypothetical protein
MECVGGGPRSFACLRSGANQTPVRKGIEKQFGHLGSEVWNRVALLAPCGKLLHMRPDGEGVAVSANLPRGRRVELAVFDEAYGRSALASTVTPGSLIFGCAGLDALIAEPRPWEQIAPTTYLYGEIVHLSDAPKFANLSFSVLTKMTS